MLRKRKFFLLAAGLAVVVGLFSTEGALWAEKFFALPDGSAEAMVVWVVVIAGALVVATGLRQVE